MALHPNINQELILFFPDFWEKYVPKRRKTEFLIEFKEKFNLNSYESFRYRLRKYNFTKAEQEFISEWFADDFTEELKQELIDNMKTEEELL